MSFPDLEARNPNFTGSLFERTCPSIAQLEERGTVKEIHCAIPRSLVRSRFEGLFASSSIIEVIVGGILADGTNQVAGEHETAVKRAQDYISNCVCVHGPELLEPRGTWGGAFRLVHIGCYQHPQLLY
jgi:hypothetical protein